ncbi:MAG: SpoIIE family protein phosphatase [Actinomadura sp.]
MNPRFVIKDPAPAALPHRVGPATFGVDLDGRIVSWSSAAAGLFARPAESALGADLGDLLAGPEDRKSVEEALSEIRRGRRWSGILGIAPGSDGTAYPVEFDWDPAHSAEAHVLAMVSAFPAGRGPEAVAVQERLALLNLASSRIGSTLDMGQTAAELVDVAVPRFADAAGVLVQENLITEDAFPDRPDDGTAVVRRLAVAVAEPDVADWKKAFPVDELTVYPEWTPYAQCMATAQPIMFTRMDTELAEDIGRRAWEREEVVRVLDRTSFLVVPLKARGTVLGFLVLTRRPERVQFHEEDVALAEELAARAAVCIDNARHYNRERRTALTLQSSLLPTSLRTPPGLEIARRYLPASDLTGVGGDWFDVIPLPGGRVALVVGDVMGHGTRAAATMGQLRTAVRTLATLDLPPAEVLFRLDQMTQDLDATQIATCVYATYDPVGRGWAFARAGHVPPVILRPDGSTQVLDLPAGLPLGIGGEPFETRELRIPAGSTLVLYTDGLVESRERDVDAGIAELRATLGGGGLDGLEEMCDTTIEALRPNHDRDDIALMVARVHRLTPEQVATATLPASPSSARTARALTRTTLAAWGLSAMIDTADLLISEMVANAALHGDGPIEVGLLRGTTLVMEVADASPAPPQLRGSDPLAESGRGLRLINSLAQRWGTRRAGSGKIVWCELAILPPDAL